MIEFSELIENYENKKKKIFFLHKYYSECYFIGLMACYKNYQI